MDGTPFWLIAAGLVGFVGREIVSFFLKDWLTKHRDSLRRAANAKLAMLLFDLLVLGGLVYLAFQVFNNEKPAVRSDILVGLGFLAFFILVVVNTFDDFVQWVRATWPPKVVPPPAPVIESSPPRGRRRKS